MAQAVEYVSCTECLVFSFSEAEQLIQVFLLYTQEVKVSTNTCVHKSSHKHMNTKSNTNSRI